MTNKKNTVKYWYTHIFSSCFFFLKVYLHFFSYIQWGSSISIFWCFSTIYLFAGMSLEHWETSGHWVTSPWTSMAHFWQMTHLPQTSSLMCCTLRHPLLCKTSIWLGISPSSNSEQRLGDDPGLVKEDCVNKPIFYFCLLKNRWHSWRETKRFKNVHANKLKYYIVKCLTTVGKGSKISKWVDEIHFWTI